MNIFVTRGGGGSITETVTRHFFSIYMIPICVCIHIVQNPFFPIKIQVQWIPFKYTEAFGSTSTNAHSHCLELTLDSLLSASVRFNGTHCTIIKILIKHLLFPIMSQNKKLFSLCEFGRAQCYILLQRTTLDIWDKT